MVDWEIGLQRIVDNIDDCEKLLTWIFIVDASYVIYYKTDSELPVIFIQHCNALPEVQGAVSLTLSHQGIDIHTPRQRRRRCLNNGGTQCGRAEASQTESFKSLGIFYQQTKQKSAMQHLQSWIGISFQHHGNAWAFETEASCSHHVFSWWCVSLS